jgi:hypothetical protein
MVRRALRPSAAPSYQVSDNSEAQAYVFDYLWIPAPPFAGTGPAGTTGVGRNYPVACNLILETYKSAPRRRRISTADPASTVSPSLTWGLATFTFTASTAG